MFGRQNAEETECRDQLAELISNPNAAKPSPDFTEVIVKSQALLEKLVTPKPFLVQLAEKTCHNLGRENAAELGHDAELEQPQVTSASKSVPSNGDAGAFAVIKILVCTFLFYIHITGISECYVNI